MRIRALATTDLTAAGPLDLAESISCDWRPGDVW
ncbi:hypothetical protein BH23CHL7_BH23CHL7_10600 [soil metagenome]